MKFTFEIWDDSDPLNHNKISNFEFDNLSQTQHFARQKVAEDEKAGTDLAYFIVDENGAIYHIWPASDATTRTSNAKHIVTGEIYSPESTPVIEGEVKPKFNSWEEFILGTSRKEQMKWCASKARKANKERLSGKPDIQIDAEDVWKVLESAKGICFHCGSLALEKRPSDSKGRPIPWAYMGRRIGSLNHIKPRAKGGENDLENLKWSCLWCSTWKSERRQGAMDHGGYPVKKA